MSPRKRGKEVVYNAIANLAFVVTAVIKAVKAYMHTYKHQRTTVLREKRPRILKQENGVESGRQRRHINKVLEQIPEGWASNCMRQTIGDVATAKFTRLALMAEPRRRAPMVTNGTQVSMNQCISKSRRNMLIGRKNMGNVNLIVSRIKELSKFAQQKTGKVKRGREFTNGFVNA